MCCFSENITNFWTNCRLCHRYYRLLNLLILGIICCTCAMCGLTVQGIRGLKLRSTRFQFLSVRCHVMTPGKSFTHTCLCNGVVAVMFCDCGANRRLEFTGPIGYQDFWEADGHPPSVCSCLSCVARTARTTTWLCTTEWHRPGRWLVGSAVKMEPNSSLRALLCSSSSRPAHTALLASIIQASHYRSSTDGKVSNILHCNVDI